MKKILIFLIFFSLSSCWIDLDKDDESGASNTSGYEGLSDSQILDTDGDLLEDGFETVLGLNPSKVDLPTIVPASVKSLLNISTDEGGRYKLTSTSSDMSHEITKRLSGNILTNHYLIETDRENSLDSWLFGSSSILQLSLKDRMVILNHIENGHRIDGDMTLSIDLRFNSLTQVQKYQNIIGALSTLDRQTGEFEELRSFTFKSPRGGNLQVANSERKSFVLNVATSLPILYITEENLKELVSGRKELVFSIKSYSYELGGNQYLSTDVYENILTRNSIFFFLAKNLLSREYVPLNSGVGSILRNMGKSYQSSALGEILTVNELSSTNTAAINPNLLKDYEYERTNWYGLNNQNNINSSVLENHHSGILNISNIDLAKGINKTFKSTKKHTNDYNLSLLRNDVVLIKVKLLQKYPRITRHNYIVKGQYKREVCRCLPSRGDTRELNSGVECDGRLQCDIQTGPTECRGWYTKYHGIINESLLFNNEYLEFLTVKLGKSKFSAQDLIEKGRGYVSQDMTTLYLEFDRSELSSTNLNIFTERKKSKKFIHGHQAFYGSCDIDHFMAGYRERVEENLPESEYLMIDVESNTNGINRVASKK